MNKKLTVDITADNSQFVKQVKDTEKNIGELRMEFKRLSRESLMGKTPEEINAVNRRLAELRDRISDTDAKIKSMSLDPFQKMAETAQVATTMMAGAAGAASLFGGSQEELNKLMQKTVALMAIARAAQEAADFAKQRAVGIYIKSKIAETSARLKNIFTIKTEATATASQAATEKGLIGTKKVLIGLQNLWNASIAANPIFALVAAIMALGAAVYFLTKNYKASNDTVKEHEKTLDGVIIKDAELRKSHNANVIQMRKLQNEWDVLTGKIDAFGGKIRTHVIDYQEQMTDLKEANADALDAIEKKYSGFFKTLTAGQQIKKLTEIKGQQKLFANEMTAIQQAFQNKTEADTKDHNDRELKAQLDAQKILSKTKWEQLQADIALADFARKQEQKGLAEHNEQFKTATIKHTEAVKKLRQAYNDEILKLEQERIKEQQRLTKQEFDYMIAESIAFWEQRILTANQMGIRDMEAELMILETKTQERLNAVKKGSEQEKLILAQSEKEKNEILKKGWEYQIQLSNESTIQLQDQLTLLREKYAFWGDDMEYLTSASNLYKQAIDATIEAHGAEYKGLDPLIEAYNDLIKKKEEAGIAAQKLADETTKANERIAASQEILERTSIGMASAFGASMAAMAKDGKDASSQIIKQFMAQVIAMLVAQAIEEVEWPYNMIVAAGSAAIGYALFDQVPALAQGGLASAPTMAVVGDNPNARIDPEVIAPLSKLQGMLSVDGSEKSNVEFIISGDVLKGILDKTNKYTQQYR
jgi:hypothetical protein